MRGKEQNVGQEVKWVIIRSAGYMVHVTTPPLFPHHLPPTYSPFVSSLSEGLCSSVLMSLLEQMMPFHYQMLWQEVGSISNVLTQIIQM